MGPAKPLSEQERELIYQGRAQDKTVDQIAQELHRSPRTVEKWSSRMRDEGIAGLQTRHRGPHATGALSHYPAELAQTVLNLKRQRPHQGANHVLATMGQLEAFRGQVLPSRSRVSAFFQERCPDLVRHPFPRHVSHTQPAPATAAHAVWQLDCQEKIELGDGSLANVCNVRDVWGAALIASVAFSTKTQTRWRHLSWTEIRHVLRMGFTEWNTMPDCVQTDNELVLVGNPSDTYPSQLALWLVGLGIKFQTIRPHCPTDQAQVERTHRTLDDATYGQDSLATLVHFQAALDQERHLYNLFFPSRASDCQGHPPVVAHPELLQPRRPYAPSAELALFDIQRVYDHLATMTFDRTVSASGTVGLEAHQCSIGRCYAGQAVKVRCDPERREWAFFTLVQDGDQSVEHELVRRPVKFLNASALTGLTSDSNAESAPIQLAIPCFV